jgi:hypothetical protein
VAVPPLMRARGYRRSMALDHLAGRTYGCFPFRICREKVAEFVLVTGDDPLRWVDTAPPGFAAAVLFGVAPHLLEDPDVRSAGRSVIHGEQTFTWHRPLPVEAELAVEGVIGRVRTRGDVHLVGFELRATLGGEPLVEGSSTFLMSGSAPPAGWSEEEPEPAPDDDGNPSNGTIAVSRAELVRYAAATGDWNPIHWDHGSAVAAGLPGVVVHGLLQTAWLCRSATARIRGDHPLAWARSRYRAPLRPAVAARIDRTAGDDGRYLLDLRTDAGICVSAVLEPTGGVTP